MGDLATLPDLFLQSLPQLAGLPNLSKLPRLRRVVIDNLKGLADLDALATAPNLEQLLFLDMRHVAVDDLQPLVGHPALQEATFGLGSLKRNAAAQELVAVPKVTTAFEFNSDE